MIRVAAFTPGRHVPSARFRVAQLVTSLHARSVEVREYDAPLGSYPPKAHALRPFWAVGSLASRLPAIAASHWHDVTLLQREFLSTFNTLEGWTARPRVLDVDDAVFLLRGGRFIERIASQCEAVICGNDYLADHFSRFCPSVHVAPTAVDVSRFTPPAPRAERDRRVIGWSGSSSGFSYLYEIEPALAMVLHGHRNAVLRIVSDRPPSFRTLPADRVEFIRWSPDVEVTAIQEMDVGLMPLRDSDWERGKCSYKMLLYMACGVPVVVSPVGMNQQVLGLGDCGFGAASPEQWLEAIGGLLTDAPTRARLGREGRRIVCEHFSIERVADTVAGVLRRAS